MFDAFAETSWNGFGNELLVVLGVLWKYTVQLNGLCTMCNILSILSKSVHRYTNTNWMQNRQILTSGVSVELADPDEPSLVPVTSDLVASLIDEVVDTCSTSSTAGCINDANAFKRRHYLNLFYRSQWKYTSNEHCSR